MGFRKLVRYLIKMREAWGVISDGFGWRRSFFEGRSLDAKSNPIPWYTYPAIEFIRGLKLDRCRVFEYGSGNSSVFWSHRASQVIAVENDPVWADEVRSRSVANLTVITARSKIDYVRAPVLEGGAFDIVIIDGRYRKDCAAIVTEVVDAEGMIVFDNADWYPDACEIIRSKGWVQVDFSGLGPINTYAWTTAIFFKAKFKLERVKSFVPTGGNPGGMVAT